MILKNDIWQKAIKIVSSFEGEGYTEVYGNADGAYLSIGIIQWNFGTGTLQPLFNKMFSTYPDVAEQAIGDTYYDLSDALESGTEKQWALSIQVNNKVVEPYLSALKNLCNTPEFQQVQRDYMEWYKQNAINMCEKYKLYTDRAFCLLFDVSVNNGSVRATVPDNLGYYEKMLFIADASASQKGRWYDDSYSRKICIIDGGGMVHGDTYNFDFQDTSAFEDIILFEELFDMFKDEANVSLWAKEAVDALAQLGIIKGDENGNFNPKNPLTKEMAAVIIYNTLKHLGNI